MVLLFLYSSFEGMKLEICEFLKGLLDPESRDLKDEFFDLFYGKLLPQMVDYLEKGAGKENYFTVGLVMEILACCGNTHGYRIRYYVTHNAVLQRLQALYYSPQKSIRLSMIRLLRSLISHNDENLNKYIIKHDLFAPLFKLLQSTKRDNLLSASLLDVLNLIATHSIKTLIAYIMEKYKAVVMEGQYARHAIMKKIRTKYELFPLPGAPKREIPVGKRAFLNYPTKEETKAPEEEGKMRPETDIQLAQKRLAAEAGAFTKAAEEKLRESPVKKMKEGEDPGLT